MRVAPFAVEDAEMKPVMGSGLHLVPGIHILFAGPIECARHSFASLAEDDEASYLIVNDVQTAMGLTEDLVMDAVAEIVKTRPQTCAIVLATACQTMFLGIDLDQLCKQITQRFALPSCHFEANRMSADNTPGPTRKDVPGSDRYHTKRALLSMVGQPEPGAVGGVVMLGCGDTSALSGAQLPWVRATGALRSLDELFGFGAAQVNVLCSVNWVEAATYLQERFGTPYITAPYSYSIAEIDGYYHQLEQALGCTIDVSEQRAGAQEALERALNAVAGEPLDLDLAQMARPWSCVRALLNYDFEVRNVWVDFVRAVHVEADDAQAFEWLEREHPDLIDRACVKTRDASERITVREERHEGPMGRYDKEGRPQGFGKKSGKRGRGSRKEEFLKDDECGFIVPGALSAQRTVVQTTTPEQEQWGYESVTVLMQRITEAASLSEGGQL